MLAEYLLLGAAMVTNFPVQATRSLQSAPGCEDPEVDLAVGALHLYSVRAGTDDTVFDVGQFDQPVLVMTLQWLPVDGTPCILSEDSAHDSISCESIRDVLH